MFNIILHDAVRGELADLPPVMKTKMLRLIDKLKTRATALREPDSKPLGGGIFELRTMGTDIGRGLYAYQKGRTIFLLRVFIKKTPKTPPGEIALALERLEKLLNEQS